MNIKKIREIKKDIYSKNSKPSISNKLPAEMTLKGLERFSVPIIDYAVK